MFDNLILLAAIVLLQKNNRLLPHPTSLIHKYLQSISLHTKQPICKFCLNAIFDKLRGESVDLCDQFAKQQFGCEFLQFHIILLFELVMDIGFEGEWHPLVDVVQTELLLHYVCQLDSAVIYQYGFDFFHVIFFNNEVLLAAEMLQILDDNRRSRMHFLIIRIVSPHHLQQCFNHICQSIQQKTAPTIPQLQNPPSQICHPTISLESIGFKVLVYYIIYLYFDMQQNWDLDDYYNTGGHFAADNNERNDSIENNQDNRSDREKEFNMLGDNYELQIQGQENKALMDPSGQEIGKNYDRESVEFKLQNCSDFDQYNEELTRFMESLGLYSPDRVARVMEIVMGDKKRADWIEMQFSLHCILFKKLSCYLSQIDDIEAYKQVLNVILDKKKQFYSFNFNEQSIQVMNLYLDEQNPDFNSICSLLREIADLEVPNAVQETSMYLYRYFFGLFYKSCVRQSKPIFNLFLLSKIEGDIIQNQIEENRTYFYLQNVHALDKKDMEEYIGLLFQLSKESRTVLKEYLLAVTLQLIRDNQQMEKKLLGFKIINDLIVQSKSREKLKYDIVNWLVQIKIIENFLRDSTHSRILREVQPIIHFLYESGVLDDTQIIQLMRNSLTSEQIFKVVQSMLGWLKLQHLFLVFQIIPLHFDRESSLFISFISTILSNPLICQDNSRKRKNLIIQDNRKHLDDEMEEQVDEQSQLLQQFVKRFLRYLIQFSLQHQSHYIPILLKLISSHSKLFKDDLFNEVVKLLRNNSVCSLWIIQHWLKIQTARDRGQGKYELIINLASEGVFQLMLALLARHRFSRPVVQKALSVIIFFCRFNKPLERNITEFLWKVLGLTGRDERERQQFFVFLKQLVRFEGSITEESVNLIFFEILMSLVGDWFSLRVYDCLQMLFLRLNQDCKLISFDKDHYKIQKEPLIGMDKFIYIYFNCLDLKVVKKSKDFICKLIANSDQTKQAMNRYLIAHLKKYMGYALQMNKPQDENKRQVMLLRLFELTHKNCLEKDRIEEAKENLLTFNIHTPSSYNLGAKNFTLQVNEKITLSDLRCYIGQQLNPPVKDIELWTKGKLLKGQNLTLKELKLQNGQTIAVSEREVMDIQSDIKAIQKQQLQMLSALVGSETQQQFLKFIINKYEGESIQTIANYVFDVEKMASLQEEYRQKKIEREDCVMEIEEKQRTFAVLLVEENQVLEMVLQCYRLTNNKSNTWKLIQRLPLNQTYLSKVQTHIDTGNWKDLFFNKSTQQSMYILHIITHLIKNNDALKVQILKQKQLGQYLKSWLQSIVRQKPAELEHCEEMIRLLLAEIECPIITLLDQFLQKKEMSETDFQIVTLYTKAMEKYSRQIFHIDEQVTQAMIGSLLSFDISAKVVNQLAKIYILQMIYPVQTHKCYSILNHKDLPQLLLKYGKPIEFITIATALQLQYTSSHLFLSNFVFKLIETLDLSKKQKENKLCIPSFFSCVNQLLKITPVFDAEEELRTLIKLLYHLKSDIGKFEQEEVVGYFTISLTLLDRHFKAQKEGQTQNQEIFIIAKWLFNEYLFGTKMPYPFFSLKNIRKPAYQLILKMCRYSDISREVTASVNNLMNDFKDLDQKQGDIRSGQFVGIKNLGATCYINSLIQQLYHTNFPKNLLEQDNQTGHQQSVKMLQLKKIFAHLYCGIRSPVYPNDFIETAKINGEPVRPMVQQDVNQFFASLMHNIEEEVGNSAINQTISGTVCHQIRGLQEGSQVKNVEQTFLTMMIDIKYRKNLHQAISSFTKPHVLQGENMYYSEVLHKKIRASSKSYLGKLPNLLVITLKRFCWNFEQMNRIKINDYFQFPLELELSRYAFPGRKEQNPNYFDYRLSGIIIHSGSAQSGHYYSLIKINQQWFEFNDKRVSPWDITNNLKTECFGGSDQRSKNAYMLFYERVGSNAHGCSLSKLPSTNAILQIVENQNQSFLLNRLLYDSNYIDFVKQLAHLTNKSEILKLLEKLKYYRHKNNDDEEQKKKFEQIQLKMESEAADNAGQKSPVQMVTQEEVERLAERYYPKSKVVHYDAQDNTGLNDLDMELD